MIAHIWAVAPPVVFSGILCRFLGLPRKRGAPWSEWIIWCCLTAGTAIGISSVTYFSRTLLFDCHDSLWHALGEALVFLSGAAALWAALRYSGPRLARVGADSNPRLSPPDPVVLLLVFVLALVFILTLSCSLYSFVAANGTNPHGAWDAWAIWNMRARFLYRAGDQWRIAFSQNLFHVDYPLLLPGAIARHWQLVGHESLLVPQCFAGLFTFGTVGMVMAGIALLRSPCQGLLAGILLLGTQYFVGHGIIQYADMPLAFYFVSMLVTLAIHDASSTDASPLLILAGLEAGLACWTKNEGIILVACTIVSRALFMPFLEKGLSVKQVAAFGMGLIPGIAAFTLFKIRCAASNDVMAGQNWRDTWLRLTNWSRYVMILGAAKVQCLRAITRFLGGMLIAHFFAAKIDFRPARIAAPAFAALAFSGIAYFGIYLITPHDLAWHLNTSISRLLLHLYPAFVFALLLLPRTPEEMLANQQPRSSNPVITQALQQAAA